MQKICLLIKQRWQPQASIFEIGQREDCSWDTADIGRWQQDFVLISRQRKKIAILELTRLSNMSRAQMREGYRKKIQKYAHIQLALQHYIHAGWSIEILPWVVGTGHSRICRYETSPYCPRILCYTQVTMEDHD